MAEHLPDDDAGSARPEGTPKRKAEPRKSRSGTKTLREIAVVLVSALVISAIVRTFLMQAFWVPSGSMEETLVTGDRILAWKPGGDPGRGDVVVFSDPADWLSDPPQTTGWRASVAEFGAFVGVMPSTNGDDLVKRVIGVAGDKLECCSPDGRIIRNGQPIDEPYIYPGDETDQVEFNVTVPEGRVFVMGDHRSDSADSRFHLDDHDGTVPLDDVVGRAIVIMWPISRWASLPDYQDETATAAAPPRTPPARDEGAQPGAERR